MRSSSCARSPKFLTNFRLPIDRIVPATATLVQCRKFLRSFDALQEEEHPAVLLRLHGVTFGSRRAALGVGRILKNPAEDFPEPRPQKIHQHDDLALDEAHPQKIQAKREDEGIVCREGDIEAGALRPVFRERELPFPFRDASNAPVRSISSKRLMRLRKTKCGLLGRRTAYGRHPPQRPFHLAATVGVGGGGAWRRLH